MKFGHSGCKMCPFRSDEEWQDMKERHPEDFEEACQYDEQIRHGLPKIDGEGYLHDSLQPLRSIDFLALIAAKRGKLQLSHGCGAEGACRI